MITRKCKFCEAEFVPRDNRQIYCSYNCCKRMWAKNNRKKHLEGQRKWNKTNKAKRMKRKWDKENKKWRSEYTKIYRLKPEERKKAYVRFNTRHKYGPAVECSICGTNEKVEYHHPKPYDRDVFIEVCRGCHIKIHKQESDINEDNK